MGRLLVALFLSAIAPSAALRLPSVRKAAAASAAAALIAGTSLSAQAMEPFNMEACNAKYAKSPSSCIIRRDSARAAARNEARLARVAQCEDDIEEMKKNNGVLPDSIKPATVPGAQYPTANCVGYPTYQLSKPPQDPSLPIIYGKGSTVPGW